MSAPLLLSLDQEGGPVIRFAKGMTAVPGQMALAAVIMLAGSLSLREIVMNQGGYWWGFIPRWYVFLQPVGFIIYMIAGVAETNRAPFDLPEAESELIAGYHTEYSAMKFSMFFIAEYANMVTASAFMATLFFGGWDIPFTLWDNQAPWSIGKAVSNGCIRVSNATVKRLWRLAPTGTPVQVQV